MCGSLLAMAGEIEGMRRLGLVLLALCVCAPATGDERIVVGSKNFAENRLLAEIFARLLEARTELTVERRLNLAGTQVCFEALRTGSIDLYPEYTGTGLVTLLGESPRGDATETLNHVRGEFLRRYDLRWLPPLGFENSYELAVPSELAEHHELRTISDLAAVAPQLRAGLGYEFIERDDGLPGLRQAYGLRFREVRALQQALKYQAAAAREVDCLDVYTTDGRLLVYELTVLEDDLGFFPPYQAAPLVRGTTLRAHPEIGNALSLLADALDENAMRALNLRVQEQERAHRKSRASSARGSRTGGVEAGRRGLHERGFVLPLPVVEAVRARSADRGAPRPDRAGPDARYAGRRAPGSPARAASRRGRVGDPCRRP